MPLINTKLHIQLNYTKYSVISTVDATTFEITKTELYVPIVSVKTDENKKIKSIVKH